MFSDLEETHTLSLVSSKKNHIYAELFAKTETGRNREKRLKFETDLISNKTQDIVVVLDTNTITIENRTNTLGQLNQVTTKEISLRLTSSKN